MSLWFAALLGVVQGLTEFLPISSTAHLRIVPALLGRPDPGAAFTAVIQLGTLLAVVGFFVVELGRMARAVVHDRRSPDARLALHLVVGTIPIVVCGVLLEKVITGPARSLWVVSATLVGVGAIMAVVDRRAPLDRALDSVSLRDAVLIGLGQACALIPGVSRSGATLIVALLVGFRRDAAARFSFLLSVPAIAGAGLYEMVDARHELAQAGVAPLLVATVAAAVTGYLSIAWLLRFLRTRSLVPFSVYRILLGALLVVLLATGRLTP